jgi:hypothetical protein
MNPTEWAKKRRRELSGQSRTCIGFQVPREDMDAALSLMIEGRSVTPENILIRQMVCALEVMSKRDPSRPFCVAVLEMYERNGLTIE